MARGRKPSGTKLVDKMDASDEAKRRLKVILETVGGKKSVLEACEELGVGEARFHELRAEALAGALVNLEPGQAGRPPSKELLESAHIASLKAEMMELKIDLQAARVREELAIAMPHVLKPLKKTKRPGGPQELFGPKDGTSRG